MTRNRTTARKAGAHFEQMTAEYLAWALDDDRIIRMPKHGSDDLGDIANIRFWLKPVCIECKSLSRPSYMGPYKEAMAEAERLRTPWYWVVQKVEGVNDKVIDTMGGQLAYTSVGVLDNMGLCDASGHMSDEVLELFFHRIPRTPFLACTLEILAAILNHGLPLGPEGES